VSPRHTGCGTPEAVRRSPVAANRLKSSARVSGPVRLRALERAADDAGKSWALGWADALLAEGRPVAGGWPGTMSEARARVVNCARAASYKGLLLSESSLDALSRRAYLTAKAAWHTRTGPTPSE
jgi:hypothetical protein